MDIYCYKIQHHLQEYPTVGNYKVSDNGERHLSFYISKLYDEDFELLVFIHELIEARLCQKRGISFDSITVFDKKFEELRSEGVVTEDVEPGDAPDSPYRLEHQAAETVERVAASVLGVDWSEYTALLSAMD